MKERDSFVRQIFKYQKASDFLKDYQKSRKNDSKTWSYETWARKLHQTKSTLVRTLNGKLVMSEALEKAFCQYFKFNHEEKSYFQLLVIYEKMKRLYPEIHIQLPKMDQVRETNYKISDLGGLPKENAAFLSAPEVAWLLVLLSGEGMPWSELRNVHKYFHVGLCDIEFQKLIEEGFHRRVLRDENGRLVFRSLEDVYLDGTMSDIEVSVKRYVKILDHLKKMLLTDVENGLRPVLNNRAAVIRMKSERFHELLDFTNETLMRKVLALFEDPNGDLVIDVQTFVAPIANVKPTFDPQVLIPEKKVR